MNICIIPARGGSKRIPRKNIRDFCGRPMIAWSIDAARKSDCFSRIIVSTDDAEIAEIAWTQGAEVPFDRPPELANDHAATVPVISHAVEALALSTDTMVCCLYATAPFVTSSDLEKAKKLLLEHPGAFVFPVTTFAYPIQRALRRTDSGKLSMFDPRAVTRRSQDLEEAWHDAGQFYWALAASWLKQQTVYDNEALGFPIPRYRVHDIDTLEDWETSERMMAAQD